MSTDLALTKSSALSLANTPDGLERYYPSTDSITSIADFQRFKLENLAAELFRERVYAVMVSLIKTGNWKHIVATKVMCYECRNVSENRQLKDVNSFVDEEGEVICPVCGSENVVLESVIAFQTIEEFYSWVNQELGVVKRTIMMRKEYLDRCTRLGVEEPVAFAGLVKWGVAWMFLARRIEASVTKKSMTGEEAQNIMKNYAAIPDKSTVIRYTNTLKEADELELVASPHSPDFFINIISPNGEIKSSILYMAVPIKKDEVSVNYSEWWNSNIGLMVARRLHINAPITYESPMSFTPGYDFYNLAKARAILLEPLRVIARYFSIRADKYEIDATKLDKEMIKTKTNYLNSLGPIQSIQRLSSTIYKLAVGIERNAFTLFMQKFQRNVNGFLNERREIPEEDSDTEITQN